MIGRFENNFIEPGPARVDRSEGQRLREPSRGCAMSWSANDSTAMHAIPAVVLGAIQGFVSTF